MGLWAGSLLALLLVMPLVGQATTKKAKPPAVKKALQPDTPPLELASEWVRELTAFRGILAKYLEEKKEGNEPMMDTIRHGSRMKLELQLSINMLKGMRLNSEQFKVLLPFVIGSYQQKIALHQEVNEIAGKFILPKDGVDYGKLAARMPEITAALEDIDKTLFNQANTLFCMMLIDQKANSQGHCNHLLITKAERKALVDQIDSGFGDSLNDKVKNYNASSAVVLRGLLVGDHKSAEDPWD